MNAPLLPEVLVQQEPGPQLPLVLATEGMLRYVWGSRWGGMLIEVVDGRVFVNGKLVEQAAPLSVSESSHDGPRSS